MSFCVYSRGAACHIALHSSFDANVGRCTIRVIVGHDIARKDSELRV